jgi:toxin ParE1/3/4
MIAENPARVGSQSRDNLAAGLRSFHLELAARRRGAASHILYNLSGRLDDGAEGLVVVPVLHERTDPARRVTRALSDL